MGMVVMRLMLVTLLTIAIATPAVAQSDTSHAGAAEFVGFKTYWAEKREGCQPMVSFTVKNASSGDIGPIDVHMEVLDKDKKSVFARGFASLPSADLPPGHAKEVVIGGDHDIAPRDCLGDMHEAAFSDINFAVRLTTTIGQDHESVEILRDAPMREERIPAQQ
jgi:hypothetical protein